MSNLSSKSQKINKPKFSYIKDTTKSPSDKFTRTVQNPTLSRAGHSAQKIRTANRCDVNRQFLSQKKPDRYYTSQKQPNKLKELFIKQRDLTIEKDYYTPHAAERKKLFQQTQQLLLRPLTSKTEQSFQALQSDCKRRQRNQQLLLNITIGDKLSSTGSIGDRNKIPSTINLGLSVPAGVSQSQGQSSSMTFKYNSNTKYDTRKNKQKQLKTEQVIKCSGGLGTIYEKILKFQKQSIQQQKQMKNMFSQFQKSLDKLAGIVGVA